MEAILVNFKFIKEQKVDDDNDNDEYSYQDSHYDCDGDYEVDDQLLS